VYRTVTSRRRRIATAGLWLLTIWSGTDVLSWADGVSWVHVVGLLSAAFLYADPLHRIWPRRRATIADLPRLRRELTPKEPEAARVRV
jgi:hypothetical protein